MSKKTFDRLVAIGNECKSLGSYDFILNQLLQTAYEVGGIEQALSLEDKLRGAS